MITILSCPHCGAFHVLINGPPRSLKCIDCDGLMEDDVSLADACLRFDLFKHGAAVRPMAAPLTTESRR